MLNQPGPAAVLGDGGFAVKRRFEVKRMRRDFARFDADYRGIRFAGQRRLNWRF